MKYLEGSNITQIEQNIDDNKNSIVTGNDPSTLDCYYQDDLSLPMDEEIEVVDFYPNLSKHEKIKKNGPYNLVNNHNNSSSNNENHNYNINNRNETVTHESLLQESYENMYQLENELSTPEPVLRGSKEELSFIKLLALSISFLGVQFGWALQIAFSTPLFLQLGVPPFWVSFIWMAGPVSGLIVQPIIGVISDKSEFKYGRRRPFILVGSIFIIIGLLLISNAQSIGYILGDSTKNKSIAIFIGILGFWILDLSNNVVQAPCRALLVDVAPASQQGLGSALFSIMLGCGNLFGYFMGSLDLVKILPFMKTDTRALFSISILLLIICISITLISIHENQYIPPSTTTQDNDHDQQNVNPFQVILEGVKEMPVFIQRVCWVQFFSWIGWFCFILYATTWMGVNVYKGNPNAPEGSPDRILFQEGVRRGSLGLMISSGISIISSLILPSSIRLIGIKYVYLIGNIIQTVSFALFYVVHQKIGSMFLLGLTGIPWSVVMIVPFTLVGLGISSNESGLHMGTLNIFVVIPQLLVSLGISFVISLFNGNVVYSLLTGAISSLIATLLVFRIIVPSSHPFEALIIND